MTDLFYNLDVDSYKLSHYLQYPDDVTNISSYIEARSGPDEIVFLGLQMWLKDKLETPDGIVHKMGINELREYSLDHGLPFNDQMYDLVGKPLPLRIQALPEGTITRPGTCLLQVTNTDPRFPWLTSFVETSLLRAIWYPTSVATRSRRIKAIIKEYLEKTADSTAGLPFKLHDFGFRGVSSYESGCIGGLAHLVNFQGTDTMGALKYARKYYGEHMAGFSIPAAEHSTMTSWGRDNESRAYANMIEKFGGPGIFAVVSDSYDIYNACEVIWGTELREQVKTNGGTLVIRPDSGDPLVVVLKVLDILGDKFGTKTNSKGFRMLPDYLRVIQGDGVNERTIRSLLGKMAVHGWSADNLAFGMGGEMLQAHGRDDLSFAMKASAKSINNGMSWEGFSKNPVTMSSKKSKSGRLAVVIDIDGELHTKTEAGYQFYNDINELKDVWVDGELKVETTLAEVRKRAEVR
jgi:nicotinamide phosphoribosyltransferase